MNTPFPVFSVEHCSEETNELIGKVSAVMVKAETWVGDNHIGCLLSDGRLLFGRWRGTGDLWRFRLDDWLLFQQLSDTNEFIVLDGYWGERADYVLNPSFVWEPACWTETGDHDHCGICWATISYLENQHFHSRTHGVRLCLNCHVKYVKQKSLAFIQPNAQQSAPPDAGTSGPRR